MIIKMNSVSVGQSFYHIDHKQEGYRVLTPEEELYDHIGAIPYMSADGKTINYSYIDDEVFI